MQAGSLLARHLGCRRGDRWLFNGVDIALASGEALHLAAPNGAGKSSLMRILAGLLPASTLDGPLPQVEWTGAVGLLDERHGLDMGQPLGEALAFWARLDGPLPQDALAALGLTPLLDVPVRYLSTGQKKRAALARLIGQNAPNWLLDEPLNGLDVDACALVEDIIYEHCAAGGTCIIASHQPLSLPDLRRMDLAEYAL
jgi:heme exporter protein A